MWNIKCIDCLSLSHVFAFYLLLVYKSMWMGMWVPVEVRGPWVLWNCSYKWLWTPMWVLYTLQEQQVLRTLSHLPCVHRLTTHTPFLFLRQGFTISLIGPELRSTSLCLSVLRLRCVHWPFIVKSSSYLSPDQFKYYFFACFLVIFILLHLFSEGTHAKGIRGWGGCESWFSVWIICVLYLV